jgi:hypothetical protein
MGRTCVKYVAAGAVHADFVVCGMDRCLHDLWKPLVVKAYFTVI